MMLRTINSASKERGANNTSDLPQIKFPEFTIDDINVVVFEEALDFYVAHINDTRNKEKLEFPLTEKF